MPSTTAEGSELPKHEKHHSKAKSGKHDKSDKKSKKEKKEKRSTSDGVRKSSEDKKAAKAKQAKLRQALMQEEAAANPKVEAKVKDEAMDDDSESEKAAKASLEQRETGLASNRGPDSMVRCYGMNPFSMPMCSEAWEVKLIDLVKQGCKVQAVKRGTAECNKGIRNIKMNKNTLGPALVIIAGNIHPPNVVEHVPICCEDSKTTYIFVRSRHALGEAAMTKRATCIVMLHRDGQPSKIKARLDAGSEATANKNGAMTLEKYPAELAKYQEAFDSAVAYAHEEFNLQMVPVIGNQQGYLKDPEDDREADYES